MKVDVYQQLADYRGVLKWNGYTDGIGRTFPAIDIPLYVKSHQIPVRKPKITELMSGPLATVTGSYILDAGINVIFEGAPDSLTMDVSGFIITPTSNGQWAPVDASGNPLNIGNVSYVDLVTMFLNGDMFQNVSNYIERKDPDFYVTPYGQEYINPIISNWVPTYQPQMKRQQFDMTLILEK